jgi:protein tyrosine/serine phosphatase
MAMSFLLTLATLVPATAAPERAVDPDRLALERLQAFAASKPAYDVELGREVARLVMGVWDHPVYRHPVATVLNLDGGFLDRIFNRATLEGEGQREDLPTFGTVDERLLRGGQPTDAGFRKLADLGVKTVVNLRLEEPYEALTVAGLGLRYLYLPVPDTDRPTDDQVRRFLELQRDPDAGKLYVHCAWGVNRTGTMVALWRIQNGWSPERALAEAQTYGFDERRLMADRPAALIRGFRKLDLTR